MLSQLICGIEPAEPGFRVFTVNPRLGSLLEASAEVPTHWGTIRVDLRKKGRKLDVTLQVPEGTRARVMVRDGSVKEFPSGKHRVKIPF